MGNTRKFGSGHVIVYCFLRCSLILVSILNVLHQQIEVLHMTLIAYWFLLLTSWVCSLSWQPIGNINERFYALCLKDSGVLYEDPNIQVFHLLYWLTCIAFEVSHTVFFPREVLWFYNQIFCRSVLKQSGEHIRGVLSFSWETRIPLRLFLCRL